MAEEIINKVAKSGLQSLDLEEYYIHGERAVYDIKQNLWQEMALKEKDFRTFIKEKDWSVYQDKLVALTCSVDAIVPTWAYMLLATVLQPHAKRIVFGTLEEMSTQLFVESINSIDMSQFEGHRVVVKGCSKLDVPLGAYVHLTTKLVPIAKSVMFGEPCSTVPVFKKK